MLIKSTTPIKSRFVAKTIEDNFDKSHRQLKQSKVVGEVKYKFDQIQLLLK